MAEILNEFFGHYAVLNPAYSKQVTFDGDTYPTIIAAVEASKFDKENRTSFINGGARTSLQGFARPYTQEQLNLLEKLLRERFAEGTEERKVLDSTKGMELNYANDMHRNWYGMCCCNYCATVPKHDYVGKILESIRDNKSFEG